MEGWGIHSINQYVAAGLPNINGYIIAGWLGGGGCFGNFFHAGVSGDGVAWTNDGGYFNADWGAVAKGIYHNVAEDSHLYRWGMNATSNEFT